MNTRALLLFIVCMLLAVSVGFAQSEVPYGFQLGSVAIGGNGGVTYTSALSGVHPNFNGEISVGLHKYLGLFGQGGYSPVAHETYCAYGYCADASAHITFFSGGLEVVGTNHSRIVPFGRIGFGYGLGVASASVAGFSASVSQGAPAISFGGGVRTYITKHFGFTAGVQAYRTVGNYGGNSFIMPVGGVFGQFR